MGRVGCWLVAALVIVGCSGGNSVGTVGSGGPDGGSQGDAGGSQDDAGTPPGDAGTPPDGGDPQSDAGAPSDGGDPQTDAGTPPDGGDPQSDAGTPPDGGGTPDAGAPLTPGSLDAGPWPAGNTTYGAADGILETPVVGMTTDESQNIWVATPSALYVMKPGDAHFTRFNSADGLHLQDNPVTYCADQFFAGGTDKQCRQGAASDPGIAEIVGGGENEVFVGYWGFHDWNDTSAQPDGVPTDGSWGDIYRHTGKIDRVRLAPETSTLDVVRFDVVSGNSVEFWHNRDSYRMIFDHFIHRHELYVGFEHGIDKFTPDAWFEPNASWPFNDELFWMSDHLHPMTCFHQYCNDDENRMTEMMGEWRGLALDAKGDLWVGGKWSAGKIFYTAQNAQIGADGRPDGNGNTGWFQRAGRSYEDPATGKSYTFGYQFCGTAGHEQVWGGSGWVDQPCAAQTGTPPVFWPPQPGDPVSITAVAVTPDGKSWWSSGPVAGNIAYGLASFDGKQFSYFDPVRDAGMSENDIQDMVALPDGRLVLAGANSGLTFWNPATGEHTAIHAGHGIPSDHVTRLELDMMVTPPALHVSTANGAATLRLFP